MTPPGCPILEDVTRFERDSRNLRRTMRKLRGDLNACRDCPSGADCEILKNFHSKINAAIQEISEEWNLTDLIRE